MVSLEVNCYMGRNSCCSFQKHTWTRIRDHENFGGSFDAMLEVILDSLDIQETIKRVRYFSYRERTFDLAVAGELGSPCAE